MGQTNLPKAKGALLNGADSKGAQVGQHFGDGQVYSVGLLKAKTEIPKNILAFRTTVGGITLKGGETKVLGVIDTTKFDKICIVADERIGSTCNIWVRLTITETGNEWVAFLDHFMLTPHSEITKVYNLPCKAITITIDGVGVPTNSGTLDVLLYGLY
jgi:hypothetical protein